MRFNNVEKKLCDIKPASNCSGFNDERFESFYTASRDNGSEKLAQVKSVMVMPKATTSKKNTREFFYITLIGALFAVGFAGFFLTFHSSKRAFAESEAVKQGVAAYQNISVAFQYIHDFDFEKAGFEIFEANKKFSEAESKKNGGLAFMYGMFNDDKRGIDSDILLGLVISSGLNVTESLRPILEMSAKSIFTKYEGEENVPAGKILESVFLRAKNSEAALVSLEERLFKNDFSLQEEDEQRGILKLKETIPGIKNDFKNLAEYSDFFAEFLGTDKPRNFLIVFQNSSELRSTGGFIGSYSVLSAEGGRIIKIATDDIFNLDGQLSYQVVPPKPLQKISTAWSAHDANWFLDFPTSAEKLAFFYEKSSGNPIDGVIAINQNVIKKILNITGPIQVHDYNFLLSEDNFLNIVKFKVDQNYKGENNRPKKILDDMLTLMFERISTFSNKDLRSLLNVFSESMDAKEMIFWSNNEEMNKIFADNNRNGKIAVDADADYLAVAINNMNGVDGDDTDFQNIKKTSEVKDDGFITNTIKIRRTNNGDKEKLYYIKAYVPLGAEFLTASGNFKENFGSPIDYQKSQFSIDPDILESEAVWKIDEKTKTHIYQESLKTVFGNWFLIKPGEEKELALQYKIPMQAENGAKFIFQSQPGVESMLDFDVVLPDGWKFMNPSQESFSGDFNKDMSFNVNFFR